MSGRFYESEADDIYGLMATGRWMANEKTVWKSKRGKQMLADMEAALLALPEKKLIYGFLALPPPKRRGFKRILDLFKPKRIPQVCALGAFGLYKGVSLKPFYPDAVDLEYGYDDGQEVSIDVAKSQGMTSHMAWSIGDYNDRLSHISDEERWEKMYKAIKSAQTTGRWNW